MQAQGSTGQNSIGSKAGAARDAAPMDASSAVDLMGSSRPHEGPCRVEQGSANALQIACNGMQTSAPSQRPDPWERERTGSTREQIDPERQLAPLCPHCRLWHDGRIIRFCPDRRKWTQAERDALRAIVRRRNPSLQFAPSTAQMQARFGARNRADAERTAAALSSTDYEETT